MIVQEHLPSMGVTVALAKEGDVSRIAFERDARLPAFIDVQGEIVGIWDKKCVTIDGTDYSSNTWHVLIEGSPLWNYFKDMIGQHLKDLAVFNEQSNSWQYRHRT